MKVIYEKKFLKELAKLPKNPRVVIENFIFEFLEKIDSIEDIKNIKKLQGHDYAYRIRFGDYRLGFFFKDGIMSLDRIAHRSSFYRKFPH